MHKKAFIILGLFFGAQNTFASFLGAIDFEKPPITYRSLLNQVVLHSQEEANYLSLGESHLEKDTAFPILEEIAQSYLLNTPATHAKACVEVNTGLHQAGYDWLQASFSSVEIRTGNGPATTDFKNCYKRTFQKHLIYSGFFHQFPWTKNFPGLFATTPVQTLEDNNIESQMQPANGFFVSEIELPYLVEQETRKILSQAAQDITTFSRNTALLKKQTELIHQKMEKLNSSQNKWKSKFGVVLSKSSFSAQLNIPKKFYFILTDLQYRLPESAIYFLDEITKLTENTRNSLFLLLQQNKWYYQQTHFAPDELGKPGEVYADGGRIKLDGNSSILLIALKDRTIMMINSNTPELTGIQCRVKNKTDSAYAQVSCEEAVSL